MKTESTVISAKLRKISEMIASSEEEISTERLICLEAAERIDEQEADIIKLIKLKGSYRTALHDAIRRPRGVIPASAEGLSLNYVLLNIIGEAE